MTGSYVVRRMSKRSSDLIAGPAYEARCRDCGEIITKYDFSAEDALAIAEASGHKCKGRS